MGYNPKTHKIVGFESKDTSKAGDIVTYVGKYVQFPKEYFYGDSYIALFKLELFTGDRDLGWQAEICWAFM